MHELSHLSMIVELVAQMPLALRGVAGAQCCFEDEHELEISDILDDYMRPHPNAQILHFQFRISVMYSDRLCPCRHTQCHWGWLDCPD